MITWTPAMPPFVALAAQLDTAAPHMLALNYGPLVGAAVVSKPAAPADCSRRR